MNEWRRRALQVAVAALWLAAAATVRCAEALVPVTLVKGLSHPWAARSVKGSSYLVLNLTCDLTLSGLMPRMTALPRLKRGKTSRNSQACVVQPEVSSLG